MRELTVAATLESIEAITAFVTEQLDELGCSMKVQMQFSIAIDEIISNIAQYAYHDETGMVRVCLERSEDPPAIILSFADSGVPFDPLSKDDPDITLSAEERTIGGLGIYMVKKSMDDITYAYENGQNILTIRKNIG